MIVLAYFGKATYTFQQLIGKFYQLLQGLCSQFSIHPMRWIIIKLPLTPINVQVQWFRIPQRMLLIHTLPCCLHYAISWVTCLNISIPMPPTSWPPVWPGGHNPFTPALGKYFLPDSTQHTELGGTCWLWIPAAESERKTWCEKQIRQEENKGKIRAGLWVYVCQGEGR